MGFGFVVARFGLFLRELAASGGGPVPASTGLSLWIGTALVILGVTVNLLAAAEHRWFLRSLERSSPTSPAVVPRARGVGRPRGDRARKAAYLLLPSRPSPMMSCRGHAACAAPDKAALRVLLSVRRQD
jgi:hypothetical protein